MLIKIKLYEYILECNINLNQIDEAFNTYNKLENIILDIQRKFHLRNQVIINNVTVFEGNPEVNTYLKLKNISSTTTTSSGFRLSFSIAKR